MDDDDLQMQVIEELVNALKRLETACELLRENLNELRARFDDHLAES